MRPLILCRERMNRILGILDRNGGIVSLRDFWRTYGVHEWEVEQAEELGWLRIVTRKPRVGRPSFVAEKLSESHSAKYPPCRYEIPREISYRHERFAMESVNTMPGGCFGFKMATRVRAYLKTFPNAKSRAGACASANRLMKRRDVRMARLWFQRTTQVRNFEPMPVTVDAIIHRLRELGLL
jgi:hypothetical protein